MWLLFSNRLNYLFSSERHNEWENAMNNDNTLFINAWDPWSMIGNGNKADKSLDGYWGSVSNMAYLGWPFTNFNLEKEEAYVAVPDPTW